MKKKLYTLLVLIPVFAACREDKLQDFEDPIGSVYFYIEYLQPIVTQYLVCNKSEIWP